MGRSYQPCGQRVSAFIRAMLTYQAVFQMPHTPDAMFWLTDAQAGYIGQTLHCHPCKLHHWIGQKEIQLFSLAPDSALYLMGSAGEWQMWYGARSRESFSQLEQCLDGIGEEM